MKASTAIKKFLCYIIGLCFIAVGINISKLSSMGISPVSSIPRACELIFGESGYGIKFISLGVATYIIYIILVVCQILVLRKNFKPLNLLGIAVSFLFGYMVDFFGTNPDKFGHLLANFPKPGNYALQLVYMACSLLLIGFGVFLYLRPHWIAMPAEGLAAAISQVSGKAFGNCKTAVDCSMIAVALILQLIFLGGFSSFTGDRVVVREGTIIAAICVGQVVKFLTKLIGKKFDDLIK